MPTDNTNVSLRYRLFVFGFFFDVSERKFVKSYRYHKVVAFAARADFALVQLSDFLRDRKPDAAAFDARRPCPVASEKPCKIFVEIALFNVFGVVSEFQNDDSFQFRNRLFAEILTYDFPYFTALSRRSDTICLKRPSSPYKIYFPGILTSILRSAVLASA